MQFPNGNLTRHLLIILDDFDYAESDWFTLLDYFLPFAASDRASVVFTVRPPLLAAIEDYDDRFTHYYVRNCKRITLPPLEAGRVISTRLALMLASKADGTLYGRIAARIRNNCRAMKTVLTRGGRISAEKLP